MNSLVHILASMHRTTSSNFEYTGIWEEKKKIVHERQKQKYVKNRIDGISKKQVHTFFYDRTRFIGPAGGDLRLRMVGLSMLLLLHRSFASSDGICATNTHIVIEA